MEITSGNIVEVSRILAQTTERPNGIFTDTDILHIGEVLTNIVAAGDGSQEVSFLSSC